MKLFALDGELKVETPSYSDKSYDYDEEKIEGYAEGLEALRQAIHKRLCTEQFEYPIYSFQYGIRMRKLIGKDAVYVKAELKRMIEEALIKDDRVKDVGGFSFTFQGDSCLCTFKVASIYGEFDEEVEITS